jgi:hypothetical protein
MPQFDVVLSKGWYQAECRELGILITAKSIGAVEETAVQMAKARSTEPVVLVVKASRPGLAARLADLFIRSRRPGRA